MALPLSARDLVGRVRDDTQDDGAQYSDSSVLHAIDQALEDVYKTYRLTAQGYARDSMEILTTGWTQDDPGNEFRWSYDDLPETVGSIYHVEVYDNQNRGWFPILEGELYDLERRVSAYRRRQPVWAFSGTGFPGRITVSGIRLSAFEKIRIWFTRAYAPLHYSSIGGSGITTSTTTTAVLPTAVEGSVVLRDDVYNGMSVVFEGSGQVRSITDYAGATRTITFDTLSPAPTGAYSLMVPMNGRHVDYLALRAAYKIAMRTGNDNYLAAYSRELNYMEQRFREDAAQRSPMNPRRVWSSRQ